MVGCYVNYNTKIVNMLFFKYNFYHDGTILIIVKYIERYFFLSKMNPLGFN